MAISPYKFFCIYHAVNLHFSSNYDIFKYAGKAKNITLESFKNRKDNLRFVYWAEKIQNNDEALKLCVFNYLKTNTWFYNSYTEANDELVKKKLFYSLFTKNIKKDYDIIQQFKRDKNISFDSIIKPTISGNKPPILQLYFQNYISLEFLCLLNNRYDMVNFWKNSNDPLVETESRKICKYSKFVVLFSKKV